jgi:hypothetical protein
MPKPKLKQPTAPVAVVPLVLTRILHGDAALTHVPWHELRKRLLRQADAAQLKAIRPDTVGEFIWLPCLACSSGKGQTRNLKAKSFGRRLYSAGACSGDAG